MIYHFLNKQYGLEALSKRRLKIARLLELNDPFEFLGVELSRPDVRKAFDGLKKWLDSNRGILCFSQDWRNPVQWSHYADKHRGVCLGFEIPEPPESGKRMFLPVQYSRRRLAIDVNNDWSVNKNNLETMEKLFLTKYSHWRYEREIRSFVRLDEPSQEPGKEGLYFHEFADGPLRLKRVIVGASSDITRSDVENSLGGMRGVELIKARLAFKTFRVVQQRKADMWR